MNAKKTITSKAPGRINIIGDHTDYNNGFVMPAAIDLHTTFTFTLNESESTCKIESIDMNDIYEFDLKELGKGKSWQKYIDGILFQLQENGYKISGFDAVFSGTVPLGSGLSSSASLEASFLNGLNTLFNLGINPLKMVQMSQLAEHYVGVKCGIMDQFVSFMGKKDHALLLNCATNKYELIPIDLKDYTFLLINSNVSHSLASSEYNTRRETCERSLEKIKKILPVQTLSDLKVSDLETIEKSLNETEYKRVSHVVHENDNVHQTKQAFTEGNLTKVGKLLYKGHKSISQNYEVSCPELDFIIDFCKNEKEILGARMMGGGFGGCALVLIRKTEVDSFIDRISESYSAKFDFQCSPIHIKLGNGATIINQN